MNREETINSLVQDFTEPELFEMWMASRRAQSLLRSVPITTTAPSVINNAPVLVSSGSGLKTPTKSQSVANPPKISAWSKRKASLSSFVMSCQGLFHVERSLAFLSCFFTFGLAVWFAFSPPRGPSDFLAVAILAVCNAANAVTNVATASIIFGEKSDQSMTAEPTEPPSL